MSNSSSLQSKEASEIVNLPMPSFGELRRTLLDDVDAVPEENRPFNKYWKLFLPSDDTSRPLKKHVDLGR